MLQHILKLTETYQTFVSVLTLNIMMDKRLFKVFQNWNGQAQRTNGNRTFTNSSPIDGYGRAAVRYSKSFIHSLLDRDHVSDASKTPLVP